MDELNIIMKKLLIQTHYLNTILNDTEKYIEEFINDANKIIEIINILELLNMKIEISSICIEEIKNNISADYMYKICQDNDMTIKSFKKRIEKIKLK